MSFAIGAARAGKRRPRRWGRRDSDADACGWRGEGERSGHGGGRRHLQRTHSQRRPPSSFHAPSSRSCCPSGPSIDCCEPASQKSNHGHRPATKRTTRRVTDTCDAACEQLDLSRAGLDANAPTQNRKGGVCGDPLQCEAARHADDHITRAKGAIRTGWRAAGRGRPEIGSPERVPC